jgi:hypothetical protein
MTEYEYWELKQIEKSPKYPFTMGQLHYFMLKRHKNKLDKAVRKIGKRIYIRIDLFDEWIEMQSQNQKEA